jgi:hypothetical protein
VAVGLEEAAYQAGGEHLAVAFHLEEESQAGSRTAASCQAVVASSLVAVFPAVALSIAVASCPAAESGKRTLSLFIYFLSFFSLSLVFISGLFLFFSRVRLFRSIKRLCIFFILLIRNFLV